MELLLDHITPWSISNGIAILILIAAIKKPKLGRLLFAVMFALACWINYKTAHRTPDSYLDYANFSPFPVYKNFINGWFREHILEMVTLISFGQGLIALGMVLKGWLVRLAGLGAVIFLIAIIPLGVGSAFPFSITASLAIYFILKNDDLNYLWKFKSMGNT